MLPAWELAKRRATVANAIATQRLEGLVVNSETIADLESWANGEINLTMVRERALGRIEAARLRRQAETTRPSGDEVRAEYKGSSPT
ncbi:hypothetical protein [Paraburkholderia caledonica]|uniref:antitoxin VbhA family protein n=1 Tax=Paraburkholderia caledonica TaxID=134536 RepID=UPI0012EC981E|nr:hypothetical protein [Paraburkholderia caledonica]